MEKKPRGHFWFSKIPSSIKKHTANFENVSEKGGELAMGCIAKKRKGKERKMRESCLTAESDLELKIGPF